MRRRTVVFFALAGVLTLANLLWPRTPSPLTTSSFGTAGSGHGALYTLLSESGLARGRSFESGRRLADPGTVWWIDPVGVCDGRIARSGGVDVLDEGDVAWPVGRWIREGGVAVVFLQAADAGGPLLEPQDELVDCDAIAGIRLPGRSSLGEVDEPDPAEGAHVLVGGAAATATRALPGASPHAFEDARDWAVSAWVARPGEENRPFVLSRSLGEGRLVVVADSGFTHNAFLDRLDAAPFALDLVRAFGRPRLDEREHGFLPETSVFRYIAATPARAVYVGLALLGLLHLWRGNALPPRGVREFDPAAPTLGTYVTSMGALYAATRDHGRVLLRYRELTASRLKRHFGLPQEVSRRELAERIESDPRFRAGEDGERAASSLRERLRTLVEDRPAATASEVEAAAHDLDALVMEVTR